MSVEGDPTSGTFYIDDLVATYPAGDEVKSQGDDHLRLIKKAIKNTFPNIDAPVTATEDELNYTDITTLGTMQASKVITADANNDVVVPSTGKFTFQSGANITLNTGSTLTGGSTAVTPAEISYLSGVTSAIQTQLGTKAPSASPTFTGTVTLPSTTSIGDVSAAELAVLNGITASTAELNIMDGVTATAAEINLLDGRTSLATITELNDVATTSGTSVDVTGIPDGTNRVTVRFYLCNVNGTNTIKLQAIDSSSGVVSTGAYTGGRGVILESAAADTTAVTDGISIGTPDTSGDTFTGAITLTRIGSYQADAPNPSTPWIVTGNIWFNSSGTDGDRMQSIASAFYCPTGYLSGVRLTSASTFTSGVMSVIYE